MVFTPRVQRILQEAEAEAIRSGSTSIGTEHLLLALARDDEGVAGQLLRRLGVVAAIEADVAALMSERVPPEWEAFSDHPMPWRSAVMTDAEGSPMVNADGTLRQYFIDDEGRPVLDRHGRRMHVRVGPGGRAVRDEHGVPELTPVD